MLRNTSFTCFRVVIQPKLEKLKPNDLMFHCILSYATAQGLLAKPLSTVEIKLQYNECLHAILR